jgi:hypothetical protein
MSASPDLRRADLAREAVDGAVDAIVYEDGDGFSTQQPMGVDLYGSEAHPSS